MKDRPHKLYRFFDAAGQLLYIGITMNPGVRMVGHTSNSTWWSEVASMTAEPYSNRRAVLDAETAAIKAERPLHNVTHNRRVVRKSINRPAGKERPRPQSSEEVVWMWDETLGSGGGRRLRRGRVSELPAKPTWWQCRATDEEVAAYLGSQ